jgi:hypothetical protein
MRRGGSGARRRPADRQGGQDALGPRGSDAPVENQGLAQHGHGSVALATLDVAGADALHSSRQLPQDIPRGSVVVTEEEVGDEIPQQWCTPARAASCGPATGYVITYTSYLEPAAPPADHAFWALMRRATRVITFTGFKESVTVWRLTGAGRAPGLHEGKAAAYSRVGKVARGGPSAVRRGSLAVSMSAAGKGGP